MRTNALLVSLCAGLSLAAPHAELTKRAASYTYSLAGPGLNFYSTPAPFLTLDGGITFAMQKDGNFVVYQNGVGRWTSGTATTPGSCGSNCELVFQQDGNFVLYQNSVPKFETVTYSHKGWPDKGYTMTFRNAAPWITMYDSSGDRLWYTKGLSGAVRQNPLTEGSGGGGGGGGGGGLPCGNGISCFTCESNCDFFPTNFDPTTNPN